MKTGRDPNALVANGLDFLRWLLMYASVANLCSLVLDHYIAVVKPLRYLTFMTRSRIFQMILISWTIPVVVILAFLIKWLAFDDILQFRVLSAILMVLLEFLPCCGLSFAFYHCTNGHHARWS